MSGKIRINQHGLRLHNASFMLTDDNNRSVELGAAEGLLARDAAGTIIHDIPDAPVLSDMLYGGHVIWATAPNYFGTVYLEYNDTNTSRSATSSTTNFALTSYLPTGITNVRGVFVFVRSKIELYSAKLTTYSYGELIAKYSLEYNTAPGAYQYFMWWKTQPGVSTSVNTLPRQSVLALLPVVYNGDDPYVTCNIAGNWYSMASASGVYSVHISLYYQGIIV